MSTWSSRYLDEWKNSKEEVLLALAYMINQYVFVREPLTQEQYEAMRAEVLDDWRTIRRYISTDRITTSSRSHAGDETEALLVCLHCLAMITWDRLYNKFFPESEVDVIADVSAAEEAVAQLAKFGLMRDMLRSAPPGGKWTPEGIDMLNGKLR